MVAFALKAALCRPCRTCRAEPLHAHYTSLPNASLVVQPRNNKNGGARANRGENGSRHLIILPFSLPPPPPRSEPHPLLSGLPLCASSFRFCFRVHSNKLLAELD